MKICQWCGRENEDSAEVCRECGTNEFKNPTGDSILPATASRVTVPPRSTETAPESASPRWQFRELTPQEMKLDLVTLVRCRTLAEADLVVSELSSAGIEAFIPDEFLSQAMAWNLNAFGYVRVQVSPKDYQAAKEFLIDSQSGPGPGTPPDSGPANAGNSQSEPPNQ